MDKGIPHIEKGQAMVEYALLFALVALFVIGAFTLLSSSMANVFLENLFPVLSQP